MKEHTPEMKLDMRFGDFGVKHACVIGEDNSVFKKGDTLDLVRFDGDATHYVIGKWKPGREGYVFESIGNRLFDCVEGYEAQEIWHFLRGVQEFLDNVFYES